MGNEAHRKFDNRGPLHKQFTPTGFLPFFSIPLLTDVRCVVSLLGCIFLGEVVCPLLTTALILIGAKLVVCPMLAPFWPLFVLLCTYPPPGICHSLGSCLPLLYSPSRHVGMLSTSSVPAELPEQLPGGVSTGGGGQGIFQAGGGPSQGFQLEPGALGKPQNPPSPHQPLKGCRQ